MDAANSARRKLKRESLDPMGIGIAHLGNSELVCKSSDRSEKQTQYIDIVNRSDDGFCLRITCLFNTNIPFLLEVYDNDTKTWKTCLCEGMWVQKDSKNNGFSLMGCQYRKTDQEQLWNGEDKETNVPSPDDFSFIKWTRIFQAIDRGGLCPFLNALNFCKVKSGELIMKQGDEGDVCFLVQKGICIVFIEKDLIRHQIARIREGEMVGEMALLTGEVRNASVIAETDMELWSIEKNKFDEISEKHPDVRCFLTELITERFASRNKIADRKIGKYLIQHKIGKGGYAIVYGGKHELLNMPVAIKMMKHDMAMEKDFLNNFRNEARMIAQLNHENIVKVYDIEERYQTVFIVMELLEGASLEEILENRTTLPYLKVVDYLIQICSGLQYAHDKGFIHQDIKPGNIFITTEDTVKILDFGLACPPATENVDTPGTPFYMSPEQIEMELIDERSDIYALGIMIYEILIGNRPYPEENLLKLMDLHVQEDIPDPWETDPDIPRDLRNFILKACSRNKKDRYRNMNEILAHIGPLKQNFHLDRKSVVTEKRKMTSLFLFSSESQQLELNKLLEEFSSKAQHLGITIKVTDFPNIQLGS